MSNNKKNEFTNENRKKGLNLVILGVFLVMFAGITAYLLSNNDTATSERARYTAGDFNIGTAYSYEQVTSMTPVNNKLDGDKVVLSLSEVKQAGIIYTQVPVGNSYMPITSYIAPSGRLVVAFSMCEPCNSDTFRIDGEQIICESCGTIWTLEELNPISGGCMNHPPEEIYYEVDKDTILIPFQQIQDWTPREI